MNESRLTYEWVVSHCRGPRSRASSEACPTYEGVFPHSWMSHVSHTNESCLVYVLLMNESGTVTCDWVMTHSYVRHDSFVRETWLIHEALLHVTESHVIASDSFGSKTYMRHDSFVCETWLIRTWDMTHSWGTLTCDWVTCNSAWLIHTRDMIHSHVTVPDSFISTANRRQSGTESWDYFWKLSI